MRFPGFEGEWIETQLNKITKVYDGTHQTPKYVDEGVPFYSVEHISANQYEKTKFISEEVFLSEVKRVKISKGDILMTRIGSIGVSKYIDWNVRASFYVSLALIKSNSKFSSKFLNHYISTIFFQKELWKRTIHVAFPKKINLGEIGECNALLPSKKEQQKIADFITAIDEKIQTQNKIIEHLETSIKGFREKIFKQEIRLKSEMGNNFPKWNQKKLGAISKKKSSNISANKIENNFGEYILYGASGVLKNVDFYEEENNYISIVKDGAGVGRLFYCESKSSVLGTMDIIKPQLNINTYFLFCLLSTFNFTKYVTGSTIPHIYFKDYKNENCFTPCIEEQTKIASFLSLFDEKLQVEKTLLKHLTVQKKYLLQQLFI